MNTGRVWRSIESVAGAVSIRVKIMGIVASLVLIFGLGTTLQMRAILNKELTDELERRGVSITQDVASHGIDLILTNDSYALYEMVKDTMENNRDVRYIFVTDRSGEVLVHTFGGGVTEDLVAANRLQPDQEYNIEILDTEDGFIRDIAAPIFDSRAGTVRVGMAETHVRQAVSLLTQSLVASTAGSSILGLFIAYFLTTVLVRPISQLVELTKAVARGDLNQKVPVKARDELGHLGEAFNAMTDNLASLSKDREEFSNELLERNRNLSALWEELRQKEEMRIQLLGKVISAQEEERKRIARELHDETGQSLTSILVGLKLVEASRGPDEMAEKLAGLRSLTVKALEEVHHVALELRPSALDDVGLIAALRRYVRDYSTKYEITVDFQCSVEEGLRLAAGEETALYRIVQEALTNIAKHSRATYASVLLDSRDGNLLVIVDDNGVGFDAEAAMVGSKASGASLGLFGMQERASLIGARLTVESQSGSGTTIYVELPIGLSVVEEV